MGIHRQRWFAAIPLHDPLERHHAALLKRIMIVLLSVNLLGVLLAFIAPGIPPAVQRAILFSIGFNVLVCLGSLYLLRRARFMAGLTCMIVGLLIAIFGLLIPQGLQSSWIAFFVLIYPITFAGLIGNRRLLWLTVGLSAMMIAAIAILEVATPQVVGFSAPAAGFQLTTIVSYGSLVGLLGLVIDAFGGTFRTALAATQQRERELQTVRAAQEQTIEERTAALSAALQAGEQREAQLSQTLSALTASQTMIQSLRAPMIPVLPGVLVVPLVGTIDQEQMATLTQTLLRTVEHNRITCVILDLTGLADLDEPSAQGVLGIARTTRLLGSQLMVAGMRPEIAQTVVSMQQHLDGIRPFATLHQAITWLMQHPERARAA